MLSKCLLLSVSAVFLTACSSLFLFAQTSTPGDTSPHGLNLPAVPAVTDCAALVTADISKQVGVPIKIISAAVVGQGVVPPYCSLQVEADNYARFEVHLPISTWRQRLLFGTGMGGTPAELTKGFVTTSWEDLGNRGHEDVFADHYQYRVNYGYRSMHLQVLSAKALVAAYYKHAPKFSYYNGCSEPGREGLMEVQRFPNDFDGVVTGCPPINMTVNNGLFYAWNILTNTGPDGKVIITPAKLPVIHQAVLSECDAADGLKDNIISDPLHCHPKLTEIECTPGQDPTSCLTTEQIHVALELYRGAHDQNGGKLEPIGVLPGSELMWDRVIAPKPPQPGRPVLVNDREATTYALRSEFSDPPLGTGWELNQLTFDHASFDRFTKTHDIMDATDPDISAFARAGHKLIIWQGLIDANVLPAHTILYYTALQKTLGAKSVDHFVRFYALPGVGHCGGGEGPSIRDFLTPLMAWVERGIAPGAIVASHIPQPAGETGGPGGPGGMEDTGSQPDVKPDLTRPIYPYPYAAKYIGHGSGTVAADFVRGREIPPPASLFEWWGAGFYTPHFEKWCTATGPTNLECKDKP